MPVRTFFQHVNHINQEEIPLLPPFKMENRIKDEEFIDILLYATPRSWEREMDRQGFDPMESSINDVVDFMERIESSEETDHKSSSKSAKSTKKDNGNNNKSKNGSPNKKTCLIHGQCGHSSDECKVLQAKAKENNGGSKSSWAEKAKVEKMKASKELSAYIKKSVAHGVKKELAALDRKRSAEAHAFDDLDLKEFDLENMDLDDVSV